MYMSYSCSLFLNKGKKCECLCNDDNNSDINNAVDNNTNNKQNWISKSIEINNGFSRGISVTGHHLIQVKIF